MRAILILTLSLFFSFSMLGQNLMGLVQDENGEQLIGATVQLFFESDSSQQFGAVSDLYGQFKLENLPLGYYSAQISYIGYHTMVIPELLVTAGKSELLDIVLSEDERGLIVCFVLDKSSKSRLEQSIGALSLPIEQTLRYPNMYYDPARLATAYPGVAQANDGTNMLSVRGLPPSLVQWRLFDLDIVNPNHLPNAGTLSDNPAAASGGVLLFSAQMLENTVLYTGNARTGGGDAACGLFSSDLRRGASDRQHITAQASLVGLDLTAEGPLDKAKKLSYLANYRYSTVGVLGKLGADFGGEKIAFQDLSVHLNYQTNRGNLSIFALGGESSNYFTPPDSVVIEKDLLNIDFESRTGIAGLSYKHQLGAKTNLAFSTAASKQTNNRTASGGIFNFVDEHSDEQERLSANLRLEEHVSARWFFSEGVNWTHRQADILSIRVNQFPMGGAGIHNHQDLVLAWAKANYTGRRFNLEFNHQIYHDFSQNLTRFDPRFVGETNWKGLDFALGAGVFTQAQPLWLSQSSVEENNPFRSAQFALSATKNEKQWRLKSELFYQYFFDLPLGNSPIQVFSLFNAPENLQTRSFQYDGNARTYGLELGFSRFLQKGFYTTLNTTLFNAKYKDRAGIWQNTQQNLGFIANATFGKEWRRLKNLTQTNFWGLGSRTVLSGGSWYDSDFQQMDFQNDAHNKPYFRTDLRLYWKKAVHHKRTTSLALELQNVTNHKNIAYRYPDSVQNKVLTTYQLGLIPNFTWRLEI